MAQGPHIAAAPAAVVLRPLCLAAGLGLATAAAAEARVPLAEDSAMETGLTQVAVVNALRRNCDAVSLRVLRGYGVIRRLQDRAVALGYSEDEIEAYIDSPPDKARVEGRARDWLVARGVDFDRPETFCTVARAEIAAESAVGSLLRVDR